jgi:hypothetical protein
LPVIIGIISDARNASGTDTGRSFHHPEKVLRENDEDDEVR